MIRISRVLAVAATEFRMAARNRWVFLSTLVFLLFSLALSFPGVGAAAMKADVLTLASAALATLAVYLVPLIALLLAYDSFAGEVERGTLALILATPVRRGELVAGKFLGLFGVLAIALVTGLAVSTLAAGAVYGFAPAGLAAMARLTLTALMLGAVFLAAGIAVSVAARRTGTAAATVFGLWLLAVVLWDLALLAGVVADADGFFARSVFPWLVIANPGDAFRIYNLAALGDGVQMAGIDSVAHTLPFDPAAALAVLAAWFAILIGCGQILLRRLTP
ncbi:nitrous oxidase accessory protein [Zhengella mangrovi]|uniref:Nitrous oxidase accessory protein n=1 Tax=Zhengella mangrovi TaxID=1982044 RepID=A0A2G1QQF5_9HYPH|nr:ABC transporter permease subunit [Zhengella mangrovi]PHP67709.1 nitrous oxidase accessory protein [Zhengella mangrovi]